jgi:hypothetical protein
MPPRMACLRTRLRGDGLPLGKLSGGNRMVGYGVGFLSLASGAPPGWVRAVRVPHLVTTLPLFWGLPCGAVLTGRRLGLR